MVVDEVSIKQAMSCIVLCILNVVKFTLIECRLQIDGWFDVNWERLLITLQASEQLISLK